MRHHKSQCSVLIVTNKNHTKEGLTNHKFAEDLHEPPPPPPLPLKLLNRIYIDLKNDPNGSEKNGFPLKNGKIPCLINGLGFTLCCKTELNTSITYIYYHRVPLF